MTTPRKFSEKIAILQRKNRAEEEEFQNVMGAVQPITGSGISPQTTPSGTPYPCSPTNGMPGKMPGSGVTTPSLESPMSGLKPDTLMPMYPLGGMSSYARPGGSLPNVHQMVQQNPHHAILNNFVQHPHHPNGAMNAAQWNYWAQNQAVAANVTAGGSNGQQVHTRTRSPGSSTHYHPYAPRSASSSAQRNERTSTFDQPMPDNRLQLPDNSYPRARSDPALHMNASNPYFYNQPFNVPQQPQFYQQQQPQPWMHTNGAMMPGPGMVAQPPPQHPFYGGTTGSGTTNSQTAPSSAGSSASSVPMSMNSPQQTTPNGGVGGYMKQSPCGSPDMSGVSSLPNMHSSMVQPMHNHHQQSPQHQSPQAMQQQYYDYDPQPIGQQTSPPQLHSASPIMKIKQEPGTYYHNGDFAPNGYMHQQLNTPQCQESSQSAPTSPAVGYENKRPQWANAPMTRHYSASPDNNPIPNIVLTDADGQRGADFQDYQHPDYPQDLHNEFGQITVKDIREQLQSQSYEISAENEVAILR